MEDSKLLEPLSVSVGVLQRLARWRRRNRAIRELRAMPSWRLADFGLARAQIPAFVDALLQKSVSSDPGPTPSEVQNARLQAMPGALVEGFAGH